MAIAAHPLLQLARVSSRDAQGIDARSLGAIHNLSVTLQAGVHAFVGRPADGTAALCEVIAGRRAANVGAVTVLGQEPRSSAVTRRRTGAVLPRANLSGGATVRHALAFMSEARGVPLAGCLDAFGAEHLGPRRLSSLDRSEARAVELAALLSCPELVVLAVYEPSTIVCLDQETVVRQLAALASRGGCVVVTTCAPESLGSLPDHVYLLESGRLWGCDEQVGWGMTPADPEQPAGVRGQPRSIAVFMTASHARKLAIALGDEPTIDAVRWTVHHSGLAEVVITGVALDALALTLADAVVASGVEVAAMYSAAASVDGMRAAARAHRADIEARARLATPGGVAVAPPATPDVPVDAGEPDPTGAQP